MASVTRSSKAKARPKPTKAPPEPVEAPPGPAKARPELAKARPELAKARPGRNEPCHCGSGRKYKHCCLEKDDLQDAADRAKTAGDAAAESPDAATPASARPPKPQTHQPWKATTSRGFVPRNRTPRKVGGS